MTLVSRSLGVTAIVLALLATAGCAASGKAQASATPGEAAPIHDTREYITIWEGSVPATDALRAALRAHRKAQDEASRKKVLAVIRKAGADIPDYFDPSNMKVTDLLGRRLADPAIKTLRVDLSSEGVVLLYVAQ